MFSFFENIFGKAFPFLFLIKKIFELLALILYSENRQFESPENKEVKVHAQNGREPFVLIYGQGAWRYHRI